MTLYHNHTLMLLLPQLVHIIAILECFYMEWKVEQYSFSWPDCTDPRSVFIPAWPPSTCAATCSGPYRWHLVQSVHRTNDHSRSHCSCPLLPLGRLFCNHSWKNGAGIRIHTTLWPLLPYGILTFSIGVVFNQLFCDPTSHWYLEQVSIIFKGFFFSIVY
jgi:hypothetical protein